MNKRQCQAHIPKAGVHIGTARQWFHGLEQSLVHRRPVVLWNETAKERMKPTSQRVFLCHNF